MKKSAFLDTNVVLDIVLERKEFLEEGTGILLLRDEERIELYTSALTVANAVYFARKFGRNHLSTASEILKWFSIISLTREHLETTTLSRFSDFEDGLQYFAAREIRGLDFIVTRDAKGFKESQIPVVSPKELLELFQ